MLLNLAFKYHFKLNKGKIVIPYLFISLITRFYNAVEMRLTNYIRSTTQIIARSQIGLDDTCSYYCKVLNINDYLFNLQIDIKF